VQLLLLPAGSKQKVGTLPAVSSKGCGPSLVPIHRVADKLGTRKLISNRSLVRQSAMIRPGGDNRTPRRCVLRLVDQLIAYEEGQITGEEEIALFEHLVETGTCWHLPGHYQRVAATLIAAGLIRSPWRSEPQLTSRQSKPQLTSNH
jgi:hypothetical protein